MSRYKFFHLMEVRYGDLDAQGILNNAKYLTFFEQARIHYLTELGLFQKDKSFMDIGFIIADIHIQYKAPVLLGMPIKVGVRTLKIGNKSVTLEQCMTDEKTEKIHATGTVVVVAYDYRSQITIPVPKEWREKVSEYEGRIIDGK